MKKNDPVHFLQATPPLYPANLSAETAVRTPLGRPVTKTYALHPPCISRPSYPIHLPGSPAANHPRFEPGPVLSGKAQAGQPQRPPRGVHNALLSHSSPDSQPGPAPSRPPGNPPPGVSGELTRGEHMASPVPVLLTNPLPPRKRT
ncbi:hypothetical protein L209DRAFT_755803 [Thermothelomyces heterothallicus CBS 203.75]